MKTFLIVRNSDLEIIRSYEAATPLDSTAYWSHLMVSPNATHIELPEDMSEEEVIAVDNEGTLEIEVSTDKQQALSDGKWTKVRSERDVKLKASDWTQMADSPLGSSEVTNWTTYRQELRDVPQDNGDPDSITWPTEPAPEV